MRNAARYITSLLTAAVVLAALPLQAQVGVGQWRDHLSYAQLKRLCFADGLVYAAANQGIFHFDRDEYSLTRHNKTTDLNDLGIATMAYDEGSHCLVVAYTNSNVDLVSDHGVYNVSDIKRSGLTGDKTIYSIRFSRGKAFLSCGFGIVVIDMVRHEIEETYYIGDGGSHLAVYDMAFAKGRILAATARGILVADSACRYLNIATNWVADTTSILRGMPIFQLEALGDGLLLVADGGDSSRWVYRYAMEEGRLYERSTLPWLTGDIRSLHNCDGRWVVSFFDSVNVYDTSGMLQRTVVSADWLSSMEAHDALLARDGSLWVAHNWAGLVHVSADGQKVDTYVPDGPASDNVYRLVPYKSRMFVCPGGKTSTYSNAYLDPRVYTFQKEKWTNTDNSNITTPFWDILDVAVNPKDTTQLLAASWGAGLVKVVDNKAVALYDHTNTDGALTRYTVGDFSTLHTGAVAFDSKGNAWMTNSLVQNGLAVMHKDGTWESFDTEAMVDGSELDKIIWDSVNDYKWFGGRANRIYVHDGKGRMAWVDPNYGSKMETASVTCMAQDHDGEIWIGTNKGLKVITGGYNAFKNGGAGEKAPVSCLNITISNNEFAEYLMAYESVTCLAVDGANRKWVGTAAGGLYLISDNGQEELLHFTAANSPLFSDKIVCVSVQPKTGEVFVGTDKGLQSYRGTATYATGRPDGDIHAFPNPVRSDYDGPIAIKGFSRNALVHITDAAGHVLFSTTAHGGQAIWNGRTNSGVRVATGVYFVLASDSAGKMREVAKVLVVK